MSIYSKSNRFW